MIRAVTAPAIVEELYAEYEKAKQQVVEQQLYQQMLASQGMPARLIRTHRKSDETANKVRRQYELFCNFFYISYPHVCLLRFRS
jgi:hypothetical protein